MGDGPRGLQRQRRRLGLLQPRPGALARLPVGRGWAGRHLRRPAAPLLRARALEREGPDPQGAPVRADQQRGQSRRGRQGVLLLPRLDADPLVHEVPLQVPSGGVSLRRAHASRTAAGAARTSSTSCWTRACSTTIATSTCSSSTPRRRPEDLLVEITVANRGPEAATLHVLPTLWFRNTWSWGGDAPRPGLRQAATAPRVIAASHPDLGERFLSREGSAALLFTENETNTRAALPGAQPHPVRQGRHQRLSRPRAAGRRRIPSRREPRRRRTIRSRWGRASPEPCGCGSATWRRRARRRRATGAAGRSAGTSRTR